MKHLTAKEIEQFIEGSLTPRAAIRIARHIDACGTCRALVQQQDPIHTLCRLDTEADLPRQFMDDLVSATQDTRTTLFQRLPILEASLALLIMLPATTSIALYTDLTSVLYRLVPIASEMALITSKLGANHYVQAMMLIGALLAPALLIPMIKTGIFPPTQRNA